MQVSVFTCSFGKWVSLQTCLQKFYEILLQIQKLLVFIQNIPTPIRSGGELSFYIELHVLKFFGTGSKYFDSCLETCLELPVCSMGHADWICPLVSVLWTMRNMSCHINITYYQNDCLFPGDKTKTPDRSRVSKFCWIYKKNFTCLTDW